MKHFYLKSLFICLLSMMGAKASAHDIEVKNADGVTIYYNLINNNTELEVTYCGNDSYSDEYTGNVVIPESVTYDGKTYSVTSIGISAFSGRSGLTSLTIPNSVTSISDAFRSCSGLTSITVESGNTTYDSRDNCNAIIETSTNTLIAGCMNTTIPNSVTSIGNYAFSGCSGLTSVTIGNSVTSIGECAFYGCSGLTSVTIPNNVTSIGEKAFSGCKSLQTLDISNNIDEIKNSTFQGCSALSRIEIPKGVVKVCDNAFANCSGLLYVVLPASLIYIGSNAIPSNEKKTNLNTSYYYIRMTEFTVIPGSYAELWVHKKGYAFSILNPFAIVKAKTASSIFFSFSKLKDNLDVTKFEVNGNPIDLTTYTLCLKGLNPSSSFGIEYNIVVNGETFVFKDIYRDFMQHQNWHAMYSKFSTDPLTLKTAQPKVISVGNVIVAAESNLDDEETNVGFEWRRTDWTDDFASNTGAAYLYEGMMEGYIRNLNAEKLWKFRPYYESNSGNRYYGEWVGLDPSNTSYFEPTVHTYAKVEVNGNTAEVKGYAMRGTDNVTSQGFKYWKNVAGTRGAASDIPANAKTVEANGQVMTAQLTGLDYESDYCYVAFVTTSEKETFYGEQQTFKTGVDTSGIEDARVTSEPTVTARFDLRGRRLDAPQRGMNILKMSDGTTRKVIVK